MVRLEEERRHRVRDVKYDEVALRMIRLMFVFYESRRVDISLRNLTDDWPRVEERFASIDGTKFKTSVLQSFARLGSATDIAKSYFETYPAATEQLVAYEDSGLQSFTSLEPHSDVSKPFTKIYPAVLVNDGQLAKGVRSDDTHALWSLRLYRLVSSWGMVSRLSAHPTSTFLPIPVTSRPGSCLPCILDPFTGNTCQISRTPYKFLSLMILN